VAEGVAGDFAGQAVVGGSEGREHGSTGEQQEAAAGRLPPRPEPWSRTMSFLPRILLTGGNGGLRP
jgi:hypothetical protein